MRFRFFTFCSALSFALCVTATVLWARSYGPSAGARFRHVGRTVAWRVSFDREGILLQWLTLLELPNTKPDLEADCVIPEPYASIERAYLFEGGRVLGFGYLNWSNERQLFDETGMRAIDSLTSVTTPFWFVPATTAVLPCFWTAMAFRRRSN